MKDKGSLTVPEQHQLRIARDTLKMNPFMAAVMGGPSYSEAQRIVRRLGDATDRINRKETTDE